MHDLSAIEGSQIQKLIDSLSEENFLHTREQLFNLCRAEGKYCQRILSYLVTCVSDPGCGKTTLIATLLREFLVPLLYKPNFASVACRLLEGNRIFDEEYVTWLTELLAFTAEEKLIFCLGLAHDPVRDKAERGKELVKVSAKRVDTKELLRLPLFIVVDFVTFCHDNPSIAELANGESPPRMSDEGVLNLLAGHGDDALAYSEGETLAGVMHDFGHECTKNADVFRLQVLSLFSSLTEAGIAKAVGMMAASHTSIVGERTLSWNIETFIGVIRLKFPKLNWAEVIEKLDYPGFYLPDQKALALVVAVHKKSCPDVSFPTKIMLYEWENRDGQLSLLRLATQAPPDLFSFAHSSTKKFVTDFEGQITPSFHPTWSSLDLIDILVSLGDGEREPLVREIFEPPKKQCPEILLSGFFHLERLENPLYVSLTASLFSTVLVSNNTTQFVVSLWPVSSRTFLYLAEVVCKISSSFFSRILDVSQVLKNLDAFLRRDAFPFIIDLGILAAKKGFLDLRGWATGKMAEAGVAFAAAFLDHINKKLSMGTMDDVDAALVILRVLKDNSNRIPTIPKRSLEDLESSLASAAGKNEPMGPGGYPVVVENDANAHFEQLYAGTLTVDELLGKMIDLRDSREDINRKVFEWMCLNLLEEYRYFPQFPDAHLRTTALLFGRMMKSGLFSNLSIGIARRYVLEALSQAEGSKYYQFGVVALQEFADMLPEWAEYRKELRNLPGASEGELRDLLSSPVTPTESVTVQDEKKEEVEESKEKVPTSEAPGFATTLNIDTLTKGPEMEITYPSEDIQDRVQFITNNMTESNLAQKAEELLRIVTPEFYAFFSHYLVVKRVSMEANLHNMYVALLEEINEKEIHRTVLEMSYSNIERLLDSEKITQVASERTLLKNLGSWLGMFTLRSDKPILKKHLDMKKLVMDAYIGGRLIVVIPFVAKVLDKAVQSRAFRPPNPWLMGLLGLFVEIYNLPDLKLTLKFEIEMLFKTFGLPMSKVRVKHLLKTAVVARPPVSADSDVPAADVEVSVSAPAKSEENASNASRMFDITTPPFNPAAPSTQERAPEPNFGAALMSAVRIDESIASLLQGDQWPAKILAALERAIKEIIQPVVQRSVTIASITTRDLVLKDLALEPNEEVVRHYAQVTVATLASSLAMVTCKDPLRQAFVSSLRSIVESQLGEAQSQNDNIITKLVDDNVDLGKKIIEKAAMEKAVRDVEASIEDAVVQRKKFKEGGGGVLFCDRGRMPPPDLLSFLPDVLKPQISLSGHQKKIFDDFSALGKISTSSSDTPVVAEPEKEVTKSEPVPPTVEQRVEELFSLEQTAEKLEMLMREIANLAQREVVTPDDRQKSLASFPRDHPIIVLIGQIPGILQRSAAKMDIAMSYAKHSFKRLLMENTQLGLEISFNVLEGIRSVVPELPRALTEWACTSEEQQAYRRQITVSLLRARLLSPPEFDAHLARAVAAGNIAGALEFGIQLVRKYIVEQRVFSANDLPLTLEALNHQKQRPDMADNIRILVSLAWRGEENKTEVRYDPVLAAEPSSAPLEASVSSPTKVVELDNIPQVSPSEVVPKPKSPTLVPARLERVHDANFVLLFQEWITIFQNLTENEKAVMTFLSKLEKTGVLRGPSAFEEFFTTLSEVSVDLCEERLAASSNESDSDADGLTFMEVDAFCKLVFLIVKFFVKPDQPSSKVSLVKTVADVFGKVLSSDARRKGAAFGQRVYFRFFYDMLVEISNDPSLEAIHVPNLLALSEVFDMIQPRVAPSFSFAWLQLISHRLFMPKLLLAKTPKGPVGWPAMHRLLLDVLVFMEPFLKKADFTNSMRRFYRGVLRVMLVLVHDFPEFLCDYHFSFCDAIPLDCIQLRNLILSSFPSHMRLPDPFTPNLKVDLLPEIQRSPRLFSNYATVLNSTAQLKSDVDQYLTGRSPSNILEILKNELMLPNDLAEQKGERYNIPLINSLVLYCGVFTIQQLHAKRDPPLSIVNSPAMDIFQSLAKEWDDEGVFILLNAIANHLRYPNNHTHYFSCVMLYLFADDSGEGERLQELITRVLFERLIVNRPHPWGLLVTFIELVKNPRYAFWQRSFLHCAPDIRRLFDNVARSCDPAAHRTQSEHQ